MTVGYKLGDRPWEWLHAILGWTHGAPLPSNLQHPLTFAVLSQTPPGTAVPQPEDAGDVFWDAEFQFLAGFSAPCCCCADLHLGELGPLVRTRPLPCQEQAIGQASLLGPWVLSRSAPGEEEQGFRAFSIPGSQTLSA